MSVRTVLEARSRDGTMLRVRYNDDDPQFPYFFREGDETFRRVTEITLFAVNAGGAAFLRLELPGGNQDRVLLHDDFIFSPLRYQGVTIEGRLRCFIAGRSSSIHLQIGLWSFDSQSSSGSSNYLRVMLRDVEMPNGHPQLFNTPLENLAGAEGQTNDHNAGLLQALFPFGPSTPSEWWQYGPMYVRFAPRAQGVRTVRMFRDVRLTHGAAQLPLFGLRIRASGDPIRIVQERLVESADWALRLEFSRGAGATVWNDNVAEPYVAALRTVRAGEAISLLPRLTDVQASNTSAAWELASVVREGQDLKAVLDPQDIAFGSGAAPAGGLRVDARSLQPRPEPFDLSIVHEAFRTHDGSPLVLPARIRADVSTPPPNAGPMPFMGIAFLVEQRDVPNAHAQLVRLGALDLAFVPAAVADGHDDSRLGQLRLRASPRRDGATSASFSVTLIGTLAIAELRPGGQDPVPGETAVSQCQIDDVIDGPAGTDPFVREPALVIVTEDLDPGSPPARVGPSFWLAVDECTRPGQNQTLSLRLSEDPRGGRLTGLATTAVIVVDREPFLVGQLNVAPLAAPRDIGGSLEVANWSNSAGEGAVWEIIGHQAGFELVLPPQGIGEAMEKFGQDGGRPVDVTPGQPIDFRFSPPASLRLRASFFEQRFAEAPWNLRRILGYPGQRAPGAELFRARFELLYGLACEVDAPFLRLAELASRLGHVRGRVRTDRMPQAWTGADDPRAADLRRFETAWGRVFQQTRSRVAVLEPWRDDPRQRLTLGEGVTYRLRENASRRYPMEGPVPAHLAALHDDDGLAGGATWGFESLNVYDAVWRLPRSVAAVLARPAFSALGGWGFQKAVFDEGRSTIYGDTAMGRTFFYSLERIGRIGVFWNLAKHVIVYERTVVPTAQFRDEQDQLLGVPVVRKVREYVEILEPSRDFPDFGAEPVSRGFVRGIDFKTRIIPVNGRWGSDVRREGWQVPLWNPDAAPRVYPKPHIVFRFAADSATGNDCVGPPVAEPHKLFFYTSTVEGMGANVHAWPAVRDVDFADEAQPKAPGADVPTLDPRDPDGRLPDADAVAPGYDRFTWAVEPAAVPVNLVAERTEQSLSAVVRNVAMARSYPRPDPTGPAAEAQRSARDGLQAIRGLPERLDRVFSELLASLPRRGPILDVDTVKDRLTAEIARIERDWESDVAGLVAAGRQGLATLEIGALERGARFKAEINRQLQSTAERITAFRETLAGRIQAEVGVVGSVQAARNAARRVIRQHFHGFVQQVRGISGGIDQIIARVRQAQLTARDRLDTLRADVAAFQAHVRDAEEAVAAARAVASIDLTVLVEERRRQLQAALDRLGQRVRGALGEIDGTVAGNLRESVNGAVAEVRTVSARTIEWVEETLDDLAALLDEVPDLDELEDKVRPRLQALDCARYLPGDVLAKLAGQIATLPAAHHPAVRRLIDDITDLSIDYGTELDALLASLEEQTVETVTAYVAERQLAIQNTLADLKTEIAQLPAGVQQVFEEHRQRVLADVTAAAGALEAALADASAITDAAVVRSLQSMRDAIANGMEGTLSRLARAVAGDWDARVRAVEEWVGDLERSLLDSVEEAAGDASAVVARLATVLSRAEADLAGAWQHLLDEAASRADDIARRFTDTTSDVKNYLTELARSQELFDAARARVAQIGSRIEDFAALRRGLEGVLSHAASGMRDRLERIGAEMTEKFEERFNGPLSQIGDSTLRLVRAFGDAPVIPGLELNRRRLAYFYDQLQKAVDITPAAALVDRAGDQLKALGLRVPTRQLLDRFVPDALEHLDLSKVFPDFAGLKLDRLFPGLKLPSLANDRVRVSHGVDPERRRAWLKAVTDVTLTGSQTLFSIGPVTVQLVDAHFFATADVEAGPGGIQDRKVEGNITGDWTVTIGGTPFVTFVQTVVHFDRTGKIRVDLSPDRVRLHGILAVLSDLLAGLGIEGDGFSVRIVQEGGLPVGVVALLDVPLPDTGAGAFAISGLRFGASFDLTVRPTPQGVDFSLGAGVSVGRKDAPFSITILFLGGGGWAMMGVRYAPLTGRITTSVQVGIVATASILIAFGPLRGGVWIHLGAFIEFHGRSGGSDRLVVGIMLLIRGEVSVLGIVTVGLSLLLEARYERHTGGSELIARGTVTFTIKICAFVKIKASATIEYRFGTPAPAGDGRAFSADAALDPVDVAVDHYMKMLE